MTAKDIVAELKKLGTEQTKKMWLTHGAQEPCLGVKVEDMKKIQKRVKMDYQLAVDTANGIGKVAVDLVGACKIPFAPDHIKKFEARSAIGKKRKSPKC